jgi:hypothetical protein
MHRFLEENPIRHRRYTVKAQTMQRQLWSSIDNDLRGSRRFPISAPLRYRVLGESEWRKGETENISPAGVLFRCEQGASHAARVEITFVLLTSGKDGTGLEVTCKGEVVRLDLPLDDGRLPAVAVKISDYRLHPWVRGRGDLDEWFGGSPA